MANLSIASVGDQFNKAYYPIDSPPIHYPVLKVGSGTPENFQFKTRWWGVSLSNDNTFLPEWTIDEVED
jgi:hypothetical protein